MAIQVNLESDEALVLFELLVSNRLEGFVDVPERNALWALEGAFEKILVEPFDKDYEAILERARKSVVERYGQ